MPATIYDVARRAGVSIATVSRVLRRSAPIQDETRQRVEDAVERAVRPALLAREEFTAGA